MLRNKLSKFNIILASGSPRRQRFLKELDIPFTIEIKEVASGFRMQIKEEYGDCLYPLWNDTSSRLSKALMETVSIIAYKQPVTKPMIDSIRGVDSGHMVRQLMEKGLIDVSGRADTAGRPLLYKTSPVFLNHFGLQDLSELPKPREIDEIIRDDDMAEHRQLMMELKADLTRKQ